MPAACPPDPRAVGADSTSIRRLRGHDRRGRRGAGRPVSDAVTRLSEGPGMLVRHRRPRLAGDHRRWVHSARNPPNPGSSWTSANDRTTDPDAILHIPIATTAVTLGPSPDVASSRTDSTPGSAGHAASPSTPSGTMPSPGSIGSARRWRRSAANDGRSSMRSTVLARSCGLSSLPRRAVDPLRWTGPRSHRPWRNPAGSVAARSEGSAWASCAATGCSRCRTSTRCCTTTATRSTTPTPPSHSPMRPATRRTSAASSAFDAASTG